jgi:hypothetical protein
MKRATRLALPAILALSCLSFSGVAAALTEGPPRPITVSGCPAGIASFFLASNVGGPAGACAYYMDWQGPFAAAGSVPCTLTEQKVLGQTSCLGNRLLDTPSSVISTAGCQGFDRFGLPGDVSLVLGEGPGPIGLNGVALFATSPFLPQAITIR